MSIESELSRITGLRDALRTKLISLGIINNDSADLEDCVTAVNTISARTGADLTVSGITVTAPAGHYLLSAAKTLPTVLDDIVIASPPSKRGYLPGEYFDPTGMDVHGIYSLGGYENAEKSVTGFTYPTEPLEADTASAEISYTEGGVTKTAAQAISVVTAPAAITGLVYFGAAQILCTAGSASLGEVEYSGDGGETWSTTRPQGTDAGEYTVKWRVMYGGEIIYPAETLTATIAKATPILSISLITVCFADSDADAKTLTITQCGDGAVFTASINDDSVAEVSLTSFSAGTAKVNVTAVDKSLRGSATITLTVSEGTNYTAGSAQVAVESGLNHEYDVIVSSGTYIVQPHIGLLTVTCVGGGGGGGGGDAYHYCGGGGGGSGYVEEAELELSAGTSVSVTIGSGGSRGSTKTSNSGSSSNGGDGGQTSFGTYVSAAGGSGGKRGYVSELGPTYYEGGNGGNGYAGGGGGGVGYTSAYSSTYSSRRCVYGGAGGNGKTTTGGTHAGGYGSSSTTYYGASGGGGGGAGTNGTSGTTRTSAGSCTGGSGGAGPAAGLGEGGKGGNSGCPSSGARYGYGGSGAGKSATFNGTGYGAGGYGGGYNTSSPVYAAAGSKGVCAVEYYVEPAA